jgi:ubiquinone/menaquinone biosynthesis C-methylase UbiE
MSRPLPPAAPAARATPPSRRLSWLRRLLARLLQFIFNRLYHEFAWSYDAVAWLVSAGRWNDWVRSTLPELQGPRVLEVGAGPGHLQVAMQQANLIAFGVDRSPQMIRQARRRLGQRPVRLVRGDGRRLPFAAERFDSVVLTFPAPYIREAGQELARVLRPGGRLVIADAGVPGVLGLGVRFLNWVAAQPAPFRLGYEEELAQAGFTLTRKVVRVRDSAVLLLIGTRT